MKSAGVATANNQIIVAIIISSSVHIHRVKDVNEAKDILETAKPDVVGVDISSAAIYEDLKYGFNVVKTERALPQEIEAALKSLTMLNITKDGDKTAIMSAVKALENTSS